ncbi:MAG: ABC transporter permease, partial [Oceanihabitans sp.]|nr:ABC transporter permease [Oceanihabitans sp.]
GFVFPIKEYLHYHYQYKEGWYQAINEVLALPSKTKDELRNRCEEVSQGHLKELNLEDMEYQHLVFTKN